MSSIELGRPGVREAVGARKGRERAPIRSGMHFFPLAVLLSLFYVSASEGAPAWHKGDSHLHTTFSDGSGSPTASANTAKALGCGYSTITDHNTFSGATEFQNQSTSTFIGLAGEEVTRSDGHVLAYGITSLVSASGTPQASTTAILNNNPGTSFCYIQDGRYGHSEFLQQLRDRIAGKRGYALRLDSCLRFDGSKRALVVSGRDPDLPGRNHTERNAQVYELCTGHLYGKVPGLRKS